MNIILNNLLLNFFKNHAKSGKVLFGVTGDLDNLGVYVARNGRPAAENLVDIYNAVMEQVLKEWSVLHKIPVVFVPSGEEVLILGSVDQPDEKIVMKLVLSLRKMVMTEMGKLDFLSLGTTQVSFGGKIFEDDFNNKIDNFLSILKTGTSQQELKEYYNLLLELREAMAIELDRQKFADILQGRHPVSTRQLVYTQMLNYKKSTRDLLLNLNTFSETDISALVNELGTQYGIDEHKENRVQSILNSLQNK